MTLPQLLPVHQENTAAARVGRRRAFRLAFRLAPEARGYTPAPYVNQDVPDEYQPDGLTQSLSPENAEGPVPTSTDPS